MFRVLVIKIDIEVGVRVTLLAVDLGQSKFPSLDEEKGCRIFVGVWLYSAVYNWNLC